jgi:hypothetical protein
MLGREAEAVEFDRRAGEVRKANNEKFYDPERGTYYTGIRTRRTRPREKKSGIRVFVIPGVV